MAAAGQPRQHGLGYESPTEHNVASALAANNLIHRLNDLERRSTLNDLERRNTLNELERRNTSRDGAARQRQPKMETVDELIKKRHNFEGSPSAVSLKDRIACFQWTWFTSTMATGGIANVIASGELNRWRQKWEFAGHWN